MSGKERHSTAEATSLILTARQMQAADQQTIKEFGISGFQLMQNAGIHIAEAVVTELQDEDSDASVLVVAGPGNNGGDGFVAARLLNEKGVDTSVALLGHTGKLKGDAAEHARQAIKAGVEVIEIRKAAAMQQLKKKLTVSRCVVDAIFGTGLARPVEGLMAEAVSLINESGRFVLAVDIASGINSDSGEVMGCAVRADKTLPIAATKWGQWLQKGRDYAGEILPAAEIGIPASVLNDAQRDEAKGIRAARVLNEQDICCAFPHRQRDAHKKSFGHLWIFGGAPGYTGAPRLASQGAQAVRTGLVSIACPESVYPVVAASSLESMVHAEKEVPWQQSTTALVAGPGWGERQSRDVVELMLCEVPLVLDADALNMLSREPTKAQQLLLHRKSPTVLTPHPGEAARLLATTAAAIQEERVDTALHLANKFRAWVVLKGAETLVASPDGELFLSPFGSVNLAVAGTGDVLAGMIGGLLAQGIDTGVALRAAIALHGLAGESNQWHRAGQLEDIVARLVERLCQV